MKKTQSIPAFVLRQYAIGKIQGIKPVTAGLIHQTFEMKTEQGQYIMQRLHPILSSDKIGQDFLMVTRHLHACKFPAPSCVLTKSGSVLAKDGSAVWRMQTKLSGQTIDRIENPNIAREAGEIYARFHRTMDSLSHTFQSPLVLHQTEKVLVKFLSVIKKFQKSPLMPDVKAEVDFIKQTFPKYLLPANVPKRVIHGDPKISNILFLRGKGHALIDLDTCSRSTILVELGDAFRSWCGKEEDDPRNTFSLSLFKAAWRGYKNGADGFLTKRETALVPKAIGTITLELAARFLTDYFEDSYFGWDTKHYSSRRAHNLARCRGQLKEFSDYQKKLPQIKKIVQ